MNKFNSSSLAERSLLAPGPEIITLYPNRNLTGKNEPETVRRKKFHPAGTIFRALSGVSFTAICRNLLLCFFLGTALIFLQAFLALPSEARLIADNGTQTESLTPADDASGQEGGVIISESEDPLTQMIRSDGAGYSKYYTSIRIQKGDTLWSIARKYNRHSGMTDEEYIDELRHMNSISGLDIHAGHYLTVCYFR